MNPLFTNSDIKDIFSNSSSLPVTIPFRCDVPVILYCDGNKCAELGANIPYQIKCTIGTHTISLVSSEVSNITKEFLVESITSGTEQAIIVNIATEVAKAKKIEERKKSKINKRKRREREKKLLEELKEGKTWLSNEERDLYNRHKSKKDSLSNCFMAIFLVSCSICLVSLIIIALGWIKGTGHDSFWTWLFWSSLATGITGIILLETTED